MEQLLRTRLTEAYEVDHPVVSAGMGFVAATPDLAIAVSNAGGIGGVDLVIAQGTEAGGHNFRTLPTFALVPLVADAVAPALVPI